MRSPEARHLLPRCADPCGKLRYASETDAQLGCVLAAMDGKPSLVWYRSTPCRCWHLTTPGNHRRGKGGRRGAWVRQFAAGTDD